MSRKPYRIAAISDIHGNTPALEAVLADIKARGISRVYSLGDVLYGPLDPAGTCDLLRASDLELIYIRGNSDRLLLEPLLEETPPTLAENVRTLGKPRLAWLGSHHDQPLICGEILACHGSPASDEEYLLESVSPRGALPRENYAVAQKLADCRQTLVLCGHSHLPRKLRLDNGIQVINPGSVGLPVHVGETPLPHRLESGSPHARYAILERIAGGWKTELIRLDYDWHSMAELASNNGRPDWAAALLSGLAN